MDDCDSISSTDEDPLQSALQMGLRLLSRREHSRLELSRKLRKKGHESVVIEQALDGLEQQNLLSECRFVEEYIALRISKGYGPQRISQELAERGISDRMITEGLEYADPDWYLLMQRVCHQKFGGLPVDDYKDQTKRARFLEYRGFQHELIRGYLWD